MWAPTMATSEGGRLAGEGLVVVELDKVGADESGGVFGHRDQNREVVEGGGDGDEQWHDFGDPRSPSASVRYLVPFPNHRDQMTGR